MLPTLPHPISPYLTYTHARARLGGRATTWSDDGSERVARWPASAFNATTTSSRHDVMITPCGLNVAWKCTCPRHAQDDCGHELTRAMCSQSSINHLSVPIMLQGFPPCVTPLTCLPLPCPSALQDTPPTFRLIFPTSTNHTEAVSNCTKFLCPQLQVDIRQSTLGYVSPPVQTRRCRLVACCVCTSRLLSTSARFEMSSLHGFQSIPLQLVIALELALPTQNLACALGASSCDCRDVCLVAVR